MSNTSTNSDRNPPEGYIPFGVALHVLAGNTSDALNAASTFLRVAVDSQGITGTGERIDDVRVRWWQPDRREGLDDLHVNARDVEALRERFADWIGEHVSAAQLAPALRATSTEQDPTGPKKYVDAGKGLCLRHLVDLMKSRNPGKGDGKKTLRAALTERFKISKRQFNSVWDAAVTESGNVAWSKPGRRKGKKS